MLYMWLITYALRGTHHITLFGYTYTAITGPLPQLETWRWPQPLPTLCGRKVARARRPRPERYHPLEHAREDPPHTLELKHLHPTEAKITVFHQAEQPNSSAWTPQIIYQRSTKTPMNPCKHPRMKEVREATTDPHQSAPCSNPPNTITLLFSETPQFR